MKRVLNLKVAIAVFVLVAGVVGFLATVPKAEAFLGVCTYYKDATYKKVVGQRGTGCCGEDMSWGIVSAFRKCETIYCLDIVCPNPTE
jgi:hypothetical protein